MSNFEGSLVPELFSMVEKNHHRLIIVANKIDALPRGFKIETLHKWIKDRVMAQF
jgi:ribosome biogenesis GTPase A